MSWLFKKRESESDSERGWEWEGVKVGRRAALQQLGVGSAQGRKLKKAEERLEVQGSDVSYEAFKRKKNPLKWKHLAYVPSVYSFSPLCATYTNK